MRIDRKLRPILELLFHQLLRCFRHQAERISAEINERLVLAAERDIKLIAKAPERIFRVKPQRKIFVRGERHHYSTADYADFADSKDLFGNGEGAPGGIESDPEIHAEQIALAIYL